METPEEFDRFVKLSSDVSEIKGILTVSTASNTAQLSAHETSINSLSTVTATNVEKLNALNEKFTTIDNKVNSQTAKMMAVITPIVAFAALLFNVIIELIKLK